MRALCESPLTFQAIIIWRDELNEGKVLLRDIIDLDATFAGPEAKKIDRSAEGAAPPPSGAPSGEAEGEPDEDDEEADANMSLSAMEMELKPKVLGSFDVIASTYKKLRRLQDQSVELQAKNKELGTAQQNRLTKLSSEIIDEVKGCRSIIIVLRRWLSSFTPSISVWSGWKPSFGVWRKKPASRARISSSNIRAMNMKPIGRAVSAA